MGTVVAKSLETKKTSHRSYLKNEVENHFRLPPERKRALAEVKQTITSQRGGPEPTKINTQGKKGE